MFCNYIFWCRTSAIELEGFAWCPCYSWSSLLGILQSFILHGPPFAVFCWSFRKGVFHCQAGSRWGVITVFFLSECPAFSSFSLNLFHFWTLVRFLSFSFLPFFYAILVVSYFSDSFSSCLRVFLPSRLVNGRVCVGGGYTVKVYCNAGLHGHTQPGWHSLICVYFPWQKINL